MVSNEICFERVRACISQTAYHKRVTTIFGTFIRGTVGSRPKKKSLRHCVYTGPVSQVYDMRTAPNLLQAKSSVLIISPQSIKQVGKRYKLACKWKGCEIKFILTDDKAFLLLVIVDVTSTKFLSLFDSYQTSELKIGGLREGSDSSMLLIIQ